MIDIFEKDWEFDAVSDLGLDANAEDFVVDEDEEDDEEEGDGTDL